MNNNRTHATNGDSPQGGNKHENNSSVQQAKSGSPQTPVTGGEPNSGAVTAGKKSTTPREIPLTKPYSGKRSVDPSSVQGNPPVGNTMPVANQRPNTTPNQGMNQRPAVNPNQGVNQRPNTTPNQSMNQRPAINPNQGANLAPGMNNPSQNVLARHAQAPTSTHGHRKQKKPAKKGLIFVVIGGVVLALIALVLCIWFFFLKDYLANKDADPVPVTSIATLTGFASSTSIPRYAGIVESQKSIEVKKDEEKKIQEIYVNEGDEVAIGDQLFTYDTEELKLELQQANIDLEQAKSTITTINANIAKLEKEKTSAPSDEKLAYTNQIQALEFDIKKEEYNVTEQTNKVTKLNESIQNVDVVSELDGVIKSMNPDGKKTDQSGQPMPFMTIMALGDYRVKGTVSELNISVLSEGTPVSIRSRVDQTMIWSGMIESIDFENPITSNSNDYGGGAMMGPGGSGEAQTQSSKYNFYISLEGLDGLILGQHVYIEPDTGITSGKEGLWLPEFYIVRDETENSYVWVKNDKEKLEKRTVAVGERDDSDSTYEIISGLSNKDFIAYPDETLKNGMPTTEEAFGFNRTDPDENASTDPNMGIDPEKDFTEGDPTSGNPDGFVPEGESSMESEAFDPNSASKLEDVNLSYQDFIPQNKQVKHSNRDFETSSEGALQ